MRRGGTDRAGQTWQAFRMLDENETARMTPSNDRSGLDPAAVGRPALEAADIFHRPGGAWRRANAGHPNLGQLEAVRAERRAAPPSRAAARTPSAAMSNDVAAGGA